MPPTVAQDDSQMILQQGGGRGLCRRRRSGWLGGGTCDSQMCGGLAECSKELFPYGSDSLKSSFLGDPSSTLLQSGWFSRKQNMTILFLSLETQTRTLEPSADVRALHCLASAINSIMSHASHGTHGIHSSPGKQNQQNISICIISVICSMSIMIPTYPES